MATPDLILNYSDVRFDEQGKPYWTTQSGRRSYLPPAAAAQSPNMRAREWAASQGEVYDRDASGAATGVQSNAAPTNTFAHQNNGWNDQSGQFDTGMNWGGLGGAILGGAAVAGPAVIGPAIAGAAGGGAAGGAAASGAAADGAIPFTTAPGVSAAAASGAVGPSAGMGASAPLGSLSVGGGATGVAGAAGGGAQATHSLLSNLQNPSNIASLAGIISSLAGGGGSNNNTAETQRIQAITEARMRRVDPLHQMVTQLAASRMPINVQRPVPDVPLP